MSFVPNQAHREDIAQSGCDELRIFADQQFQTRCKILICAHDEMKLEIGLNVTPGIHLAVRPSSIFPGKSANLDGVAADPLDSAKCGHFMPPDSLVGCDSI